MLLLRLPRGLLSLLRLLLRGRGVLRYVPVRSATAGARIRMRSHPIWSPPEKDRGR